MGAEEELDSYTPPSKSSSGAKPKRPSFDLIEPGAGSAAVIGIDQRFGPSYRESDVVYDVEAGVAAVAPRFRDGDEWRFAWLGREDIAAVQQALDNAGLLAGTYPLGVWDEKSAKAMQQVLGHANRSGLSWEAALEQMASGGAALAAAKGPSGPKRAPFQPQLSNPDDLRNVFRQAAYTRLGASGFIDDAALDRMVASYQEQEIRAQRARYDGGKVVDPPSAQTFAEGEIEAMDPKGAEAARFAGYVNVLESMLGGG